MKRNKYNKDIYKAVKKGGKFLVSKTDKNPLEEHGKVPSHLYNETIPPLLDKAAFKINGALGYKRGSNPILGSARFSLIRIVLGILAFVLFSGLIASISA